MALEASSGLYANFVLSLLLKKIIVPADFHSQAQAIKQMLKNDMTGLIDSLTDFSVDAASVKFGIEADNKEFANILQYWLDNINAEYKGRVPRGINALAKEYFKERWKGASFPVLKILKWGKMKGFVVPTKMCIIDGGSIYSKPVKGSEMKKQLLGYDYYLGKDITKTGEKLNEGVIFSRPSGRWYDEYPTPFLIKRGIYNNYKIIQSIKKQETDLLEQIIPYMLHITRGTEKLATEGTKIYSQPELDEVRQQIQDFMDEMRNTNTSEKATKSPVRTAQFDEVIKHMIPDMSALFDKDLFVVAERNILSGMGFLDVVEATSITQKQSILNPKIFIKEVKSGVKDFKDHFLTELVARIKERNYSVHKKYVNGETRIVNSPITLLVTDQFKEIVRQMYDRGRLSSQTAVEIIAEVEFETEVKRREAETKAGIEEKMYPVITKNQEQKGMDNPPKNKEKEIPDVDKNGKKIPDDKRDKTEQEEYNIGTKQEMKDIEDLVGAPYPTIKSLPDEVKKLSITKQRKWMKVWNNAYNFYLGKTGDKKIAETKAFKVAWNSIKVKKKEK